jgi:hypothetical protein
MHVTLVPRSRVKGRRPGLTGMFQHIYPFTRHSAPASKTFNLHSAIFMQECKRNNLIV